MSFPIHFAFYLLTSETFDFCFVSSLHFRGFPFRVAEVGLVFFPLLPVTRCFFHRRITYLDKLHRVKLQFRYRFFAIRCANLYGRGQHDDRGVARFSERERESERNVFRENYGIFDNERGKPVHLKIGPIHIHLCSSLTVRLFPSQDFSPRVRNQKPFNRSSVRLASWKIDRSFSISFFVSLLFCRTMRQSWDSGRLRVGIVGTNGGCPEGTWSRAPLALRNAPTPSSSPIVLSCLHFSLDSVASLSLSLSPHPPNIVA